MEPLLVAGRNVHLPSPNRRDAATKSTAPRFYFVRGGNSSKTAISEARCHEHIYHQLDSRFKRKHDPYLE